LIELSIILKKRRENINETFRILEILQLRTIKIITMENITLKDELEDYMKRFSSKIMSEIAEMKDSIQQIKEVVSTV